MKSNKRGISLIVLVITIIVIVILAAAVVITLSNTGIIGKANDFTKRLKNKKYKYISFIIRCKNK